MGEAPEVQPVSQAPQAPQRRRLIASLLAVALVAGAPMTLASVVQEASDKVPHTVAHPVLYSATHSSGSANESDVGTGNISSCSGGGCGKCTDGWCPDVVSLAQSKGLQPGGVLPLVFVNNGYWPILLNNFVAMSRVRKVLARYSWREAPLAGVAHSRPAAPSAWGSGTGRSAT